MMDIPRPQKTISTPVPQEASRVVQFVKYNNTIPIVLGIIFLGTTGAMAATPEVRSAVYTANARTVSIDNSRILSVDPDTYPLSIQIRSVTEDTDKYYVRYTLTTLGLVDGVWTDTALSKELVVYKDALGERDLGTYVSAELAEVREYERRLLADTQAIEKTNGLSQKVVATTYSGLVGKYLSPTEEVISGYSPVVEEGGPSAPAGSDPNRLANPIASLTFDANAPGGPVLTVGQTQPEPSGTAGSAGDTTPPEVSLLGESPAYVSLGGSYTDLGVAATDNVSRTLRVRRFVNNTEVSSVSIPTNVEATYSIRYRVTDDAGNATERIRSVVIGGTPSSGGGGGAPEPEPTQPPAPEPSPSPDPSPTPSSDAPSAESGESSPEPSAGSESAGSGDSAGSSGESSDGGADSAPSE
jgi:hypothetical protein